MEWGNEEMVTMVQSGNFRTGKKEKNSE